MESNYSGMTYNCWTMCGVKDRFHCKNIHCSGNAHYVPPKAKVKPKQGGGKPSTKARSKIRKDDGTTKFNWSN